MYESIAVVYPPAYVNELPITPQGILVSPMETVLAKVRERTNQDAGMSDDTSMRLTKNNVVWRTGSIYDGSFSGLLLVFGKGDLYIYCSQQQTDVDIQEVIKKGRNVGTITDNAVDVTVDGLGSGSYTIYAVLAYNNQYVGPFPKKCAN